MCHILPFALYSDIQNLLVSASAIRHCVVDDAHLGVLVEAGTCPEGRWEDGIGVNYNSSLPPLLL
jgi:hypothetical protein